MTYTYNPYHNRLNSKNQKVRIRTALKMFNNTFLSDELRQQAQEVLEEEFRDQLDEEWDTDRREHWWNDEEIQRSYGNSEYLQFCNDQIVYMLTSRD